MMIKKSKKFHRLSTKFIFGIVVILVLNLVITLFIHSQIAKPYYLHQQSAFVRQIGTHLKDYINSGILPDEAIQNLEASENVFIAYTANTSDYDALSYHLQEKFRQKGLGFQKFWLWDNDYITAIQKGYQFRFYQQNKLNYGILVEYIPIDSHLYAVATIVPNTADFTKIINQFSILLYGFSLLISIIFIYLLVKHITNPLNQMVIFSKQISKQEYGLLNIQTKDELEHVGNSMNHMSHSIQQYQKMLQSKNQQMEQLLSSVAHDLKTPISLIGMYSSGIKDGLDDGTFLDTIIFQNKKISQMTEQLLSLSRIEQKEHSISMIQLDKLLEQCIQEQQIFLKERNLSIQKDIASNAEIAGNEALLIELLSNLISNAIKYASFGVIEIVLYKIEKQWCFRISNQYQNDALDIEQIWEPFYVGESSRNKALSGTGLGLSIAKKIAEQFGYSIQCIQKDHTISFEINF